MHVAMDIYLLYHELLELLKGVVMTAASRYDPVLMFLFRSIWSSSCL
jgi:hypothetical protein